MAPRYLAGPGPDTDLALNVLMMKRSWPHHSDNDSGNVFAHSPCGRVDIAFMGDYLSPWQIRVSSEPMEEPAWFAAFGGNTPVEIVAAFLETLADTLEHLPSHLTTSRSIYIKEATRTLEQAGWSKEITETHTRITPPGPRANLAGLSIQQAPEPWESKDLDRYAETVTIWGGPKGSGAYWEAKFTRDTPLHLVAAATRSMITPAPVLRDRDSLDPLVLPHLTPAPVPASRAASARATTGSSVRAAAGQQRTADTSSPVAPARCSETAWRR